MLNPSRYLTEEGISLFQKLISAVERLSAQLNSALADLTKEDEGPWDLYEVMKEELLFWEADLRFKHKIKKEITEESKALVKLPYNILLGILCLVERILYQSLKDGTSLKITVSSKRGSPCVAFEWEGERACLKGLEKLEGLIHPYATLDHKEGSLAICFSP